MSAATLCTPLSAADTFQSQLLSALPRAGSFLQLPLFRGGPDFHNGHDLAPLRRGFSFQGREACHIDPNRN
jgi:hypothetical protein